MNMDEFVNYQLEFFNSLDIPGKAHCIVTQIGAPIIRLRNINLPRMSNGLAVKKINA